MAFRTWALQTQTSLHPTDKTFQFLLGDYNRNGTLDLYAIKKSNTGSNSSEVHVLDGASAFKNWLLHTGSKLHETDDTFQFGIGDFNRNGIQDVFAFKMSNTGTHSTEVHILNGGDNFQSYLLQTGTALHETDNTFCFLVGDYTLDGKPDVYAIKKSRTGSNSTEVHILSGASNYQTFVQHTGTPLHETDDTFAFALGYWSGGRRPDLYCIKKSATGTNSSEVHILSGDSNYQTFVMHTGTVLHETDHTWEFLGGVYLSRPCLYGIKKTYSGAPCTEVHIMSLTDPPTPHPTPNPTPTPVPVPVPVPVPSNIGNGIADLARSKCGCPYVYGAQGPNQFDCSGLVMWCHQQVGISLPRTSSSQAAHPAKAVISSWNALQPGDVLFFSMDLNGKIGHCAISLGGTTFVHSPQPGQRITQVTANSWWLQAGRFKYGKRFW